MSKIIWSTGDRFQVLSSRNKPLSLDVELYGVFVKSGTLVIAKTARELSPREKREGATLEMSAREDYVGEWSVFHNKSKAKDGYAEAVPLDTNSQYVPPEVMIIFTALEMAEKAPVK